MMKTWMPLATALMLLGSAGCGKKQDPSSSTAGEPNAAPAVEMEPAFAEHLGFATQVPGDVDFYLAGYHADQAIRGFMEALMKDDPITPEDDGEDASSRAEVLEAIPYVGDEVFLWIGPGAGEKLGLIGTSYRDITAAWTGYAVGTVLKLAGESDAEPDLSSLGEGLSGDLIEKWMDTFERDSQLQIPSVVMGWKPAAEKHDECLAKIIGLLGELWIDKPGVTTVDTTVDGVPLKGVELSGRIAFADMITEARAALAKTDLDAEDIIKGHITPERVERLLDALENMRFTVAAASKDGRVMFYLGNGTQGFQLAKTPDVSLAASKALQWTREFKDTESAAMLYLSEPMVRAALPWLDNSAYWQALSGVMGPPIQDVPVFRGLLDVMANTAGELAVRAAQPWSALWLSDDGFRLESSGGWPDPGLDYMTPLRMTDAAISQKPAIRAHWVQQRDRNDLEWKRIECFAHLIDATLNEFRANEGSGLEMIPDDLLTRLLAEIRDANRAYRSEFRAGIGDEVALIADMRGEVPPFPGISEDTVKNASAPRFLLVRPVTDRQQLEKAGESFVNVWKNLSALTAEQLDGTQAAILPQAIESGGLTTWFPPLPFIGGDFIPGVSLNDDWWMLGTSQSMAIEFSKAMKSPGQGGETGMIIEMDFAAMRVWFQDIYQRNEEHAGDLTQVVPDEMLEVANKENLEKAGDALNRLQGLTIRKWMANGTPRSSFHLKIADPDS